MVVDIGGDNEALCINLAGTISPEQLGGAGRRRIRKPRRGGDGSELLAQTASERAQHLHLSRVVSPLFAL